MCDYVSVKEILDYDGNISMVCRWVQELLVYYFTVLLQSKYTMKDVDTLTCRFGPLVAQHMMTADILSTLDRCARLVAYVEKLDSSFNIT